MTPIETLIDDVVEIKKEEPEWFLGLTGNLWFSRNEEDGEVEDDEYFFYLGPEDQIDGEIGLHDCLSCNLWIEKVLEPLESKWNASFHIGFAENYHGINKKDLTVKDAHRIMDDIITTVESHLPSGVKLNIEKDDWDEDD